MPMISATGEARERRHRRTHGARDCTSHGSGYTPDRALGGGGGRNHPILLTENTTMIILAIIATLTAVIALCWLLFTLAVFSLPFFAGAIAAIWAYGTGAGLLGGFVVGAVAAAATFGLFRLLLLVARPAWLKIVVMVVFVAPAAMAGYHATLGIVKVTMPSDVWQIIFAIVGAIAVGITAFMRLTMMAPLGPAGRGIARTGSISV
jgi:hypothetical protein